MTQGSAAPGSDLAMAACLFAVDPYGLNGILIRSQAASNRDLFLEFLLHILPRSTPARRVPVSVSDSRLLGGLDLAATLQSGRPIAARGLLAEADGSVLILPSAERLSQTTAAHLAAALDCGSVRLERDGLSEQKAARFGIVALDEGIDDERAPAALVERIAFHIDASAFQPIADDGIDCEAVSAARKRLLSVLVDEGSIATLCSVAARCGVASLRAPLLAMRAARAAAAFAGRNTVEEPDMMIAARLVLAPRATVLPASEQPRAEAPPEPQTPEPQTLEQSDPAPTDENHDDGKRDPAPAVSTLEEVILDSVSAAIPERLLAQLKLTGASKTPARRIGKAGAIKQSGQLGRPIGVRAGALRDGVRLNIIETLRAAAPWQPLRRRDAQFRAGISLRAVPAHRVEVRSDDFRLTRYKQRTETITIFAVDASGSSAFNRLAEVKGAVELLLGDCYVRRDQVALIAFRGRSAELLLPPTRSLVRAKRCPAELPGGGATPLAMAIESASALADSIRRRGQTPIIIMMTDGQANIASDGSQGRERAVEDAISAGRRLRLAGFTALVIDTSPRARPAAARLAAEMGADYAALPYADSRALSKVAARARTK